MNRLQGKAAIVTGASKGIGAGVAKALAAEGAAVAVNYSTSREGADRVVAAIEQQGGRAIAVQGDVSKAADVERLFAEVQKAFGIPSILVNNAGVFQFMPLEAITEDEFHRQFNTNVLGTILATQEAAKRFGEGGGSIINITSVASQSSMPASSVYAASKSAVDTITRVFAMELVSKNIRVNAVAPGMTATEGAMAMMGDFTAEQQQSFVSGIPMGRIGTPEDIAQTILFLASDESSWITGERITASGGQH